MYREYGPGPASLPDDDVPEHLMVLGISLLIVDLVVIADEAMDHREEGDVGADDGGHSDGVATLDEVEPASATVQEGAHCYHGRDRGDKRAEAGLRLPDAEPLVIIEEVRLFFNSVGLLIAQKLSQLLLSEEQRVDLSQGASILGTEREAQISRSLVILCYRYFRHNY